MFLYHGCCQHYLHLSKIALLRCSSLQCKSIRAVTIPPLRHPLTSLLPTVRSWIQTTFISVYVFHCGAVEARILLHIRYIVCGDNELKSVFRLDIFLTRELQSWRHVLASFCSSSFCNSVLSLVSCHLTLKRISMFQGFAVQDICYSTRYIKTLNKDCFANTKCASKAAKVRGFIHIHEIHQSFSS